MRTSSVLETPPVDCVIVVVVVVVVVVVIPVAVFSVSTFSSAAAVAMMAVVNTPEVSTRDSRIKPRDLPMRRVVRMYRLSQ
jgi:hypothetical protein